ncbi:MAG TPA: DUF2007 domain-containing protein [Actinomycetota bacterium]|nr:DUF2007 domain-containing protein [Actinomycetota bacterium]
MRTGSRVLEPPPTITAEGGGGGGWALLLTARGIIEAELVKGVLEAAGVVPVVLDARDPSPGAWMFLSGNVNAPVRVYVPLSQLDQARLALLESGLGLEEEPKQAMPAEAVRGPGVWTWALALVLLGIVLWATVRASVT